MSEFRVEETFIDYKVTNQEDGRLNGASIYLVYWIG